MNADKKLPRVSAVEPVAYPQPIPSVLPAPGFLEIQADTYLNITRGIVRVRRPNTADITAQYIRIRIGQHGDIERIVRLRAQLQIEPLANAKTLMQGHVVREEARPNDRTD